MMLFMLELSSLTKVADFYTIRTKNMISDCMKAQ